MHGGVAYKYMFSICLKTAKYIIMEVLNIIFSSSLRHIFKSLRESQRQRPQSVG